MNSGKRKFVLVTAVTVFILLVIVLLITFGGKEKQDAKKIGFIMSGKKDEAGWNGMHYQGIKKAGNKLGIQLLVEESVKEYTGECNGAIRELAEKGAGMIILSSYNYSEEAKDLVKEYPSTVFYVNSSEYHESNMTSYFARMYQARYLAGIVAGMKTKNNRIGYVAAMANNEVNRGINAFVLGVKRVNPKAEVVVIWTGTWDNKEKEIEAANTLIEDAEVDVLTYHQNQPNVVEAAETAGVCSIGYHEALDGCSTKYLTSVVCNWELVYEQIIREYLIGKGNIRNNYWIGLEAEAVGLSKLSEEVSEDIRQELEKAKTEILDGRDVFSGVIYDREGNLRCGANEFISDEFLLERMDWYVEGVKFYEK